MSSRGHQSDYDEETTRRCERVLVTLLGDLGPWRERIYLAGGPAPRYLVEQLPEGVAAHVGTTDVDLVIGVALGDETPETYRTLQTNLVKSDFKQGQPSYGWSRQVEGAKVTVEFLCETDQVPLGDIFNPKDEKVGTKLSAFNVRGAHLVRDDFIERELEGERLDGGGLSRVTVRIANVLLYAVLKILAFQDRHENKDAYDLIFTLLNHPGGPRATGAGARSSAVANHPQVDEALKLMEERFRDADQDGPAAYAAFLTTEADDDDSRARRRQEAVATVRAFVRGFHEGAS